MKIYKDYGFIRGVCHGPNPEKSQEILEKELAMAQRLQINSTRFWMSQEDWERIRKGIKA